MNLPKLTCRLQAAADMLEYAESVIDIGTDHGYLPIYLLKTGKVKKCVAADIKKGPLDNAKENISLFGAECETLLSDGFKSVKEKYSAAFICGMGGETIAEIIRAGGDVTPETLILQPMTGAEKLRKYLFENGYRIQNESFACEGEKVYCLIKAEYDGKHLPFTYADTFLGKIRPETKEFEKWKQKVCAQAQKRLLGGKNDGDIELIRICNENI